MRVRQFIPSSSFYRVEEAKCPTSECHLSLVLVE